MSIDWSAKLDGWRAVYGVKTLPAVGRERFSKLVEKFPAAEMLRGLYEVTNGMSFRLFRVLPIENLADVKRTWDGIERGNTAQVSPYFSGSVELLARFFVFADIGLRHAGAIDVHDQTIWYEDGGELRQTNLALDEFIELCLRQQSEH